MDKKQWPPLRKARDSIKPARPVGNAVSILTTLLDEIQDLKKRVAKLEKKKRPKSTKQKDQ